MTVYGGKSCFGVEPHNIESFKGEEDDAQNGHAEPVPLWEDQGEELIEINLVAEGEKAQPIFLRL